MSIDRTAWPKELMHAESCAWRFGMNAECNCGLAASEAVRKAHAAYIEHERRVDVQLALFPPSINQGLTGQTKPATNIRRKRRPSTAKKGV